MADTATETVNIGPHERELRRLLGILVMFLTIFAAVALWWLDAAPLWSLILLPFFYQGVRFMLDYRTGICPLKAELGQEKLDSRFSILGTKIRDRNRIEAIRTKSRRALAQSLVAAAILTVATYFFLSATTP